MDLYRGKIKLNVPEKILDLVEKFDFNINKYKKGSNEEEVKNWFIGPLFEELGWDVRNLNNKSPDQADVRFEDTLESGKRPDYSFWIDGKRKFFVDAKDPSVNIEEGINPAFQVKRYGWSCKNMPLVIVTDFEEFAIYDCRTEPFKTDKPEKARFKIIKYYEFEKRWDEIASLFSKEAVQKGSLESIPIPHGKKVDEALLEDISEWRNALAVNIAKINPSLDQKSLNHAVQMTIDRILFLRICEDRSIEDDGRLKMLLDGENVYQRLLEIFIEADKRYNSGLFHFHAEKDRNNFDTITPSIQIEDKVLKGIIKGLYYPDSPYVFSEIPAEILGHVYEQFLGKVIQLDENCKVNIEFKPEVRKAGGVYYTPSYIVNYIVKNTVGKLLEGKTPREASVLRILDPACGSGSFLIGAYQYLLDWHLDWYKSNLVPFKNAGFKDTSKEVQGLLPAPIEKPSKNARAKSRRIWERASVATLPIEPRTDKGWHLRTAERKRILLNNIYGVDIDTQAVEVTKLSLLLKVLEGENKATIADLTMYSDERALPDLGTNIKCGNSLIGWDIQQEIPDLTQEELWKINPFDWQKGFSDGFDAVIGNPPYGMVNDERYKEYYNQNYVTVEGRYDNFELFLEKGINLTRNLGYLGLIIPSPFLTNVYTRRLRRYILETTAIREIINFGFDVFLDPTIHTCIIILSPGTDLNNTMKIRKQVLKREELLAEANRNMLQSTVGNNPNYTFDIFIDSDIANMISKLNEKCTSLGKNYFIRQCIKTGDDKQYVMNSEDILPDPWKPSLKGRSIGRYSIEEKDIYVKYGPWLARNWKNITFYETPKIAIRETGKKIIATMDLENRYFLSSLYAIYPKETREKTSLPYLLGILNSRFATFFMKVIALDLTKGVFTKVRTNQLARLPIPKIDFSNPADVICHNQIISLVEKMLDLHKHLDSYMTEHEKTMLSRQIEATDRQIDALVYELYGLTEEEIKIVEGT
jgi:type I restriction-modification system DNA methylase subunit